MGIGNTFGGYASVCINDVLLGGRLFVFNSRILQKFHALVPCALADASTSTTGITTTTTTRSMEGGGEGGARWKRPPGADVRNAADYFVKLSGALSPEEEVAMRPIYDHTGYFRKTAFFKFRN